MINPIINANGTPGSSLEEAFLGAAQKVREVMVAVQNVQPHERDYDTPSSFRLAVKEHSQLLMALESINRDLHMSAASVRQQINESLRKGMPQW